MTIAAMTLVRILLAFLAPVVLWAVPERAAKDRETPSGAAILDRFVEATGGRAAFDKLDNRVRHDRVMHVGMGFEDTAVIYSARPNKRLVHIESEAIGDIQSGTDGNLVWYLPPEASPLIEEGAAREAQLAEAAFDRLDNWRAYYDTVELVGETTVGDRACYEVLLTPSVGAPETHYYDKETGLLVKVRKTRLSSCMPAIVLELLFDDYRTVDGVKLPHKVDRKFEQCGTPREMLFLTERIEHNVDLPPDLFTPPSSVLAAAAVEKIGGFIKGLTGAPKEASRAPCGSRTTKTKKPCATGKAKAQSKTPCGGGS